MVAITFGAVFVVVNSATFARPWPVVARVAAVVVAVVLAVGLVRVSRTAASAGRVPESGFVDRRYWMIVLAEAVALFGGLAVINGVLHRSVVAVAWVAVVVGVHFFGLGWIWRMPLYHRLGAAMTVLGLAGFLSYAAGGPAAVVDLVAGVGSGVALDVAVVVSLRAAVRHRPTAAGEPAR